jgi:hypothetical protein
MAPIFGAILFAGWGHCYVSLAGHFGLGLRGRAGSSSSVACDELLTLDVPNSLAASLLAG